MLRRYNARMSSNAYHGTLVLQKKNTISHTYNGNLKLNTFESTGQNFVHVTFKIPEK